MQISQAKFKTLGSPTSIGLSLGLLTFLSLSTLLMVPQIYKGATRHA